MIYTFQTKKAVKLCFNAQNRDLTRLEPEQIDEYAQRRQEKYLKAIEILR